MSIGASFMLLAGCATTAPAPPAPSPLQVVEAERAFAADVAANGIKRGFLDFVAEDGLVFQPGPTRAKPGLEAQPDAPPGGPSISWWPLWAGISKSGDLGFTTGAANIPVRYFTVWQKQADGQWKWIYDGGPRLTGKMSEPPGSPVFYLAPAGAAAGSPEKALAEIAPLESDLAAIAVTDAKAARLKYLAEDGMVAGSTQVSNNGRAEQIAELDRQSKIISMKPLGGTSSRAGDMAALMARCGGAPTRNRIGAIMRAYGRSGAKDGGWSPK